MKSPERNVLVDGNNILHRAQAVHVDLPIKRGEAPTTTSDGFHTGLIRGTLGMLSDWLPSMRRPSRIIFFKDGTAARRKVMDPGYKDRESHGFGSKVGTTLSDGTVVSSDIEAVDHILLLLGVDLCHHPDEESDDLIASFIHSRPDGAIHFIVSGDRDFYQLLNNNVVQYRPGLQGDRFFDAERAASDFGVRPQHVRMFKALTGDVTDTYKGIHRLRSKVATKLAEFPDPTSMYLSPLDGCSNLEKKRILEGRDRVEMNFLLAGMHSDIDLAPYTRASTPDPDRAIHILKALDIYGVDPTSFATSHSGSVRVSEPTVDFISSDSFSDL